jgi:hypothetical protein
VGEKPETLETVGLPITIIEGQGQEKADALKGAAAFFGVVDKLVIVNAGVIFF